MTEYNTSFTRLAVLKRGVCVLVGRVKVREGRSRVFFQVCQSSQELFLGCHKHEVLPVGVACLCILCINPHLLYSKTNWALWILLTTHLTSIPIPVITEKACNNLGCAIYLQGIFFCHHFPGLTGWGPLSLHVSNQDCFSSFTVYGSCQVSAAFAYFRVWGLYLNPDITENIWVSSLRGKDGWTDGKMQRQKENRENE